MTRTRRSRAVVFRFGVALLAMAVWVAVFNTSHASAATADRIGVHLAEVNVGDPQAVVFDSGTTGLAGLRRALVKVGLASALETAGRGIYVLNQPLVIGPGAQLEVKEVQLRLASAGNLFVGLEVRGGEMRISNATVTSWDPTTNKPDITTTDGRAYLLARDRARMDVFNSVLSNLGYDEYERYGVSWRTKDTRGTIEGSRFSGNFFGAYMYQTRPMEVTRSVFEKSIKYGLDLHTKSDNFVIKGNVFRHNGKHGAILAVKCVGGRILNNESYGNLMHGIVVFDDSNNALIRGNKIFENGQAGLSVNGSSNVGVRGNRIWGNETGIIVHHGSKDAVIDGNRISGNKSRGLLIASEKAAVEASDNRIDNNGGAGVWVSAGTVKIGRNRIVRNDTGIRVVDDTPRVKVLNNRIEGNFKDGFSIGKTEGLQISKNRILNNGWAFSVGTRGDADRFKRANSVGKQRETSERVRKPEEAT